MLYSILGYSKMEYLCYGYLRSQRGDNPITQRPNRKVRNRSVLTWGLNKYRLMKWKDFLIYTGLSIVVLAGFFSLYTHKAPEGDSGLTQEEAANFLKDEGAVRDVTHEIYLSSLKELDDPALVAYAQDVVEPRCPFYKPDGATYRACLVDLVTELKKGKDVNRVGTSEDFCTSLTKSYSGTEAGELQLTCVAYQLSRAHP